MSALSPEYIAQCRPDLLRFAASRLGASAATEDVVQDTLLAALRNCDTYAGRSSPKTWLLGVLDHKIKDAIRWRVSSSYWVKIPEEYEDAGGPDTQDFTSAECPERALSQQQFLACCDDCLSKLPSRQAQAFFLRECMDLDSRFICQELQISETNLNVTLFRARQGLRTCLEARGFAPGRMSTASNHAFKK